MSAFPKFDPWAKIEKPEVPPAKVAKVAKVGVESGNFSNFSNFSSPPPRFSEIPGVPDEWVAGHARLRAMGRPHSYPASRWQLLIANSEIFLREWAEEAARLGWDAHGLYGTDKLAPYHRLDRAGLLLLVGDHRITGLEKDSAILRTTTGAPQTYRRNERVASTLTPTRKLVWDLAGGISDEERMDREERAAIQEFDG